jgi:heme-degrading monooxygenase HmoA
VSWKPFIRAISGQREKYLLHIAWDTEEDLENYRNSEFFNEVWTLRKIIQRQT